MFTGTLDQQHMKAATTHDFEEYSKDELRVLFPAFVPTLYEKAKHVADNSPPEVAVAVLDGKVTIVQAYALSDRSPVEQTSMLRDNTFVSTAKAVLEEQAKAKLNYFRKRDTSVLRTILNWFKS